MKSPFLTLLLLAAFSLLDSVSAAQGPLRNVEARILDISPSARLRIAIHNTGTSPLRIWKEKNSWGAARWRVLRVRDGKLETFFQNPDQLFTRNIPGFTEVQRETSVELDLNGGNWCSSLGCSSFDEQGIAGKKVTFQRGDIVFVIFDVPPSEEAVKMGVWYGTVATFTTF
jgi:hypothetical protein